LLKVIITKEATLPAKRAAEADGFVIIEPWEESRSRKRERDI
jgi:hypothetical protein